jgi:hypothetical protein
MAMGIGFRILNKTVDAPIPYPDPDAMLSIFINTIDGIAADATLVFCIESKAVRAFIVF